MVFQPPDELFHFATVTRTGAEDEDLASTLYTARVIPYYEGVAVPLEESRILWQR